MEQMMKEIVIKSYSEDYKDDVIDLILDIQQNEFNITINREDQPDLSDIPNFYQSGNGNFWVALCNGQVIGTISLIDIGNHQGALRKMFVKAAFRGSSFNTAKLLLLQLITWARERDVHDIYLGTTEKFLAAHRFYEKNEFAKIDKELLPSTFPNMKVDTRFYKLNLYKGDGILNKINLVQKFSLFNDFWSPKIVGELNNSYIKLAKLKGEFDWHHHENEDELFLVVKGQLLIKFRDTEILLDEGELIVIPKGVDHLPVATDEVHVILIEPKGTLNTGNVITEKTKQTLGTI